MRTMKYFAAVLLTAVIMLLGIPAMTVSAAQIKLYDEGGRLTSEQFAECEKRIRQASDKTGMNIAVVLGVQNRSDTAIEVLADTSYDELFGKKTDGLLYYMDLKGNAPYDYISTSGMGQMYYTNADNNNRVYDMLKEISTYLYPVGSEDVYGGVMKFCELTEYYYEQGVPDRYYVYDDQYHEYYHAENGELITTRNKPYYDWYMIPFMAVFGGVTGLFVAGIVFLVVKIRYKFKSSLSPTTYVNRKNVTYREQYDKFVRTSTSRVRIESSSSGGGGGGGGGGYSSGGHGGGGYHR